MQKCENNNFRTAEFPEAKALREMTAYLLNQKKTVILLLPPIGEDCIEISQQVPYHSIKVTDLIVHPVHLISFIVFVYSHFLGAGQLLARGAGTDAADLPGGPPQLEAGSIQVSPMVELAALTFNSASGSPMLMCRGAIQLL